MATKPPVHATAIGQRWRKRLGLAACATSLAAMAVGLAAVVSPPQLQASDHDDGDIDVRSRALSLTDLYVFREADQNPAARGEDLVFVMNTNPRSLARQEYYFSNQAQYEFNIARAANVNAPAVITPNVKLRFTFTPPDARTRRQRMTITVIRDGRSTVISRTPEGRPLLTTPLRSAENPTLNEISVGGSRLTVFAGLREDPFFFDVEQYFRVRAGLLGFGPAVGFRPPETAIDFAAGYNVNTIAVRVPRRFLQNGTNATTFDTWLSLLVPDPRTGRFVQTEQLARPAINEGLVVNQESLAAYNQVMPTRDRSAGVLAVRNEAKRTLLAVGNSNARAEALLNALLPDVMRIDTTGPSGYANALNRSGAPVRGRMLLDDVIDITLAVVTNGAVTTDNVSYEGTPGNAGQGHDPLQPAFPYLALPN